MTEEKKILSDSFGEIVDHPKPVVYPPGWCPGCGASPAMACECGSINESRKVKP